MVKSLYDPVVAENAKKEVAKNLLDILPVEEIAKRTELPIEVIEKLKKETGNK